MENVVTIKLDEVEVNQNVYPVDSERYSVGPYARWFNEKSLAWTKDPEKNKFFLMRQQDYANEKLKAKGYLFLNELYDMVGIPKSKAGQVVGWMLNGDGDGYIDFGLFSHNNEDFINGYKNSILLDPNVDGIILDQI
jgi:hypothetical protein